MYYYSENEQLILLISYENIVSSIVLNVVLNVKIQ